MGMCRVASQRTVANKLLISTWNMGLTLANKTAKKHFTAILSRIKFENQTNVRNN